MTRTTPPYVCALTILALATAMTAHLPLAAQSTPRLFPSREYLPRLLSAPREPVTMAKFVLSAVAPHEFGPGLEGEVAIGAAIPLYLVAGETLSDGLVVGAEGGIFGRFSLKTITHDLIATDWVFAIPILLHRGDHWFQLRYHHVSAHLGDEYGARFGAEPRTYGRDAVEATAFYQAEPAIGVYGGLRVAYNVNPDDDKRIVTRVGVQVERKHNDALLQPYAAGDVQWDQNDEWDPTLNLQLGARLPEFSGRRVVRVAAELLTGASPLRQLSGGHTTQLTLGIYIDP